MEKHTYENCHNITCRRKCQKDGYNMAINEFAEKIKDFIAKSVEDAENSNDLCCEIFQSEIDEIALQMKGEKE